MVGRKSFKPFGFRSILKHALLIAVVWICGLWLSNVDWLQVEHRIIFTTSVGIWLVKGWWFWDVFGPIRGLIFVFPLYTFRGWNSLVYHKKNTSKPKPFGFGVTKTTQKTLPESGLTQVSGLDPHRRWAAVWWLHNPGRKTMVLFPSREDQVIQAVTFLAPSWRSLNLWKSHWNIPKKGHKDLPGTCIP